MSRAVDMRALLPRVVSPENECKMLALIVASLSTSRDGGLSDATGFLWLAVAFGAVGIPIITLAQVTGLDVLKLSQMAGRQLPFFSLLVPFWLVAAQAGWRGMKAVWPACLVAGGTFGLVQFLVSNLHGPWLVDIVAGAASMLAVVVLMRFWRPAEEQSNPAAPAAESA